MSEMELKQLTDKLDSIERITLLGAKNVLSFDEAVYITGFKRSYLYKLVSRNVIPYYKPHGKLLYFNKEELEAWLMRNRIACVEEIERIATHHVVFNPLSR